MKVFNRSWIALLAVMLCASIAFFGCRDSEDTVGDTITIDTIAGVAAPAAGAAPITVINETAQFTGAVSWSPAVSGSFAANTVYTATITLTAKTGFTFDGVAANFFSVAGATTTNPANSGVVTAVFPVTGAAQQGSVVSINAIPLARPVNGDLADTSVNTDQFSGTVTWEPALTEGRFAASTIYTATITLTAKTGFTFVGIGADFFDITDAASVSNAANSGTVTAVFPETSDTLDPTVDIAAISGVTAPVAGETAVTTIEETAQFTGTVSWEPALVDGKFAGGQAYTATITLTVKEGFRFGGVAADFFTVAGAQATNIAESNIVTAVFPATDLLPVNISLITGVKAPVALEAPDLTMTASAQFTGVVAWNTSEETFTAGTIYTASITLTPAAGFTFEGLAVNFFKVLDDILGTEIAATFTPGAAAGTIVVTATFPETEVPSPVDISAVTLTAPVTGRLAASAITETAQFTGTVAWDPAPTNNTFQAGVAYTATITLARKHGFWFNEVAADFFEVAGADTVSNPEKSGVVTAAFSATAACNHTNCTAGNGCTIRALTTNKPYPFDGSASIRGEEDQQALRDAPPYSTFIIAFDDVDTAGSGTIGRLGEGVVANGGVRIDIRHNAGAGVVLVNNKAIFTMAQIWSLMDCDKAPGDVDSQGDRFNINLFAGRGLIGNIELHIPIEDFRPQCWQCGLRGCTDCYVVKWSLAEYVARTDLTWTTFTFGEQLPFDQANNTDPNTPNTSRLCTMTALSAAWNGKRLIHDLASGTVSGNRTTLPLYVGSGNGSSFVILIDDDGSLVWTAASSNTLRIALGSDGLNLDFDNDIYEIYVKGSNIRTDSRASNMRLRYSFGNNAVLSAATNYTGSIDIKTIMSVPNVAVGTGAAGSIEFTSGNNAEGAPSQTNIFQVRISEIEIRKVGER